MTLPQVITVAELARAIGWRTERLRRRLRARGAISRRGFLYYTTPERLAAALPEALEGYLASLVPEPERDECATCADMRQATAELEAQLVELTERLARSEKLRQAAERKCHPKLRLG